MDKVLEFKSLKDHYQADACVVWCFDDRFSELLEKTKIKLNLKKIDQIEIAGGAKELAGSGSGADFVLDQVGKSIKLHHPPIILLMVHKDCGAYGKLEVKDENQFLSGELKKAKASLLAYLKNNDYSASVRILLADFDGLREVD